MTLVITTCTNRKRKPVPDSLHVSSLPQAELTDLATEWARRLSAEPSRFPAGDIYGGRAFREATAAAVMLDARMLIVSAGLGLVYTGERVPPYACTVLVNAADSIGARVTGPFTLSGWWRAVSSASPFSVTLSEAVADSPGLIYAALSDSYIEMLAPDLIALPQADRTRLRVFTRTPVARIDPMLRPFVMPYDDRLDGEDTAISGTRSDFAGRALHHFADSIVTPGDTRSASAHAGAVLAALSAWRLPERPVRVRMDDASLLEVIRKHWDEERGRSSRLLPLVRRRLNIACEQRRFKNLARIVRAERA